MTENVAEMQLWNEALVFIVKLTMQNTPGFLEYFNSVMKNVDVKKGAKIASVLQNEMMGSLNKRDLSFHEW